MDEIKPKGNPYPYQLEAIKFHTSRTHSLNLFMQGLGKSLVALHSMKGLSNIIIVCPAYLKNNWGNEINKWVIGGNFTVVSYEGLKKVKGSFEGAIIDEIHYCKNKDAQRTKAVYRLATSNLKRFIGLTGTPVSKNVIDFWALLKITLQNKFNYDYWQYCNHFSNRHQMKMHGRVINQFKGLNHAQELSKLVHTCAIRKRTKDVLDLPDKIYKDIVVGINFDKELDTAFQIYVLEKRITKTISSLKLVNAVAKTKHTIELAKSLIDQNLPVIIYTDHVKSCELIAEAFKVPPIHGQAKTPRDVVVDNFNNGTNDVLVATITSLNTGVNLVRASHMIFNDFNYSAAENSQAEARIHRIGQKGTCFYYYMFASTLDQDIHKIVMEKESVANTILEET